MIDPDFPLFFPRSGVSRVDQLHNLLNIPTLNIEELLTNAGHRFHDENIVLR